MYCLEVIHALNDAAAVRSRAALSEASVAARYGYVGSAKDGLHLRLGNTLLTAFIPPGQRAARFIRQFDALKTTAGKDRYVRSRLPGRFIGA